MLSFSISISAGEGLAMGVTATSESTWMHGTKECETKQLEKTPESPDMVPRDNVDFVDKNLNIWTVKARETPHTCTQ